MHIMINTDGTTLRVRNRCFQVSDKERTRLISPHRVSSISIGARTTISAAAVALAVQYQVPVFFLHQTGKTTAQVWSVEMTNHTAIRRCQAGLDGTPLAAQLVSAWLMQKWDRQMEHLDNLAAIRPEAGAAIKLGMTAIAETKQKAMQLLQGPAAEWRQPIMGLEGLAARHYFLAINTCMPDAFKFQGRSRMPALDAFNAALNYCYGILYGQVEHAILAAGLDPYFGVLHTDQYGSKGLVYDMIEPFRPYADVFVVSRFMQHAFKEAHFEEKQGGVHISKSGKKSLIPDWFDFLEKKVPHGTGKMRRNQTIYAEAISTSAAIFRSL